MKKTLTVNLGGVVFHIDEDAYQLLDKYLSNLRIHFKQEEDSDEIMNDFEMRISELFGERIRLGYEVITIEEVEKVIKRMGKPEELFDTEATNDASSHANAADSKNKRTVHRRLFRNPDDRMIGGVAGGLAALIGWDPSVVRILVFLSAFLTQGFSFILYIFLWIIIPEARTATEKLQMQGQSVTVENIGKTVTDGFEKVVENDNNVSSERSRSLLQKILDVSVSVVGILLKITLVLIAIVLFPPLLIALFVLFILAIVLLFGGGFGLLYSIMPNVHWGTFDAYPESLLLLASICSIFLIVIPIAVIAYMILSQIFKFKPVSNSVKWTFFILWMIALTTNIILAVSFGLPDWHSFPSNIGITL